MIFAPCEYRTNLSINLEVLYITTIHCVPEPDTVFPGWGELRGGHCGCPGGVGIGRGTARIAVVRWTAVGVDIHVVT